MPAARIHATEEPLEKIFSDDFAYSIPNYQRPYAWTNEEAAELFDDVAITAGQDLAAMDERDPYFLGSIVLVKEEDSPESEVIDGQQRLTTLSILFAALRESLPAHAAEIGKYLWEKGGVITGKPDRFRLQLRNRDVQFFREYVQEPGGIGKLAELEGAKLSDSQRNIRGNALLLMKRVNDLHEEARLVLARFLLTRCYLVVVSTSDLDSAFRIFSVLNDRGLPLTHADILKADIVGKIDDAKRDQYSKRWEDLEESLGREAFQELFSHVRMIFRKEKLRATVLKELRDYVLPKYRPDAFVDDLLVPYAQAFEDIRTISYESASQADDVNELLRWLSRIDNFDWVPPAIAFVSLHRNQPAELLRFLKDLERLAASMMTTRSSINDRVNRYGRILQVIEDGDDLYAATSPLQLSESEKRATRRELDGPIYSKTTARQYILLRLDRELSGGAATYDYPVISVEHVLPQNPRDDSEWWDLFDEDDHANWVHRVANLVLLTRRKNGAAQNFEFDRKKETYFATKDGVSPFALTTQVIKEPIWSTRVLDRRQKELVGMLSSLWRLDA